VSPMTRDAPSLGPDTPDQGLARPAALAISKGSANAMFSLAMFRVFCRVKGR
jgi:hypothetical protein